MAIAQVQCVFIRQMPPRLALLLVHRTNTNYAIARLFQHVYTSFIFRFARDA